MKHPAPILLALALILFALLPSQAAAYELGNERWQRSCFTHDGSPEIVAALATTATLANVTDCGYSADPDLRLEVVQSFQGQDSAVALRYPVPATRTMDFGVVQVLPQWRADPLVILHETWHLLGLNHSDDPFAVMHWRIGVSTRIQPDDIAGLRALYGPPLAPTLTPRGVALSIANDGAR